METKLNYRQLQLNYETKLQANQVNTSINKKAARFSFFLFTLGYKTAKGSVVRGNVVRGQEMLAIILDSMCSSQNQISRTFHRRSGRFAVAPCSGRLDPGQPGFRIKSRLPACRPAPRENSLNTGCRL